MLKIDLFLTKNSKHTKSRDLGGSRWIVNKIDVAAMCFEGGILHFTSPAFIDHLWKWQCQATVNCHKD